MMDIQEKAPDMDVVLSDGTERSLGAFWKKQPIVLVFLRHFG